MPDSAGATRSGGSSGGSSGGGHRTSVRRRPGRPKGNLRVASRDDVVRAALRAIERRGRMATMDDVASEASVSKPIVYRTVGDRAALSVALSEWLIQQIAAATQLAGGQASSPRERFRASVAAYFETIDAHGEVFEFVIGGQPAEVYRELIATSARPLSELCADLRGGHDVGAVIWAYSLVGSLQVVATMWHGDRFCPPSTIADELTRLAWDGLAPEQNA